MAGAGCMRGDQLDSSLETEANVHAAELGSAHALGLFVPRAALAPLRWASGGGHLLLLSREQSLARPLRDHLAQILEMIGLEEQPRVSAAVRALVGLMAGSLGRRRQPPPAVRQATGRSASWRCGPASRARRPSTGLSAALSASLRARYARSRRALEVRPAAAVTAPRPLTG
jgi:hypothetical protein